MTDKFIEKAVCTHCNEPFDVELYASVNTRVNPEMELKVLNFDAFEYTCPHCGGKVKVIYDLLYHMETEGTMIYLSLSNSVGGAIYQNGVLLPGSEERGGEFGHMRIVPEGRLCYCGQTGCLDAYCSALRLTEQTDGNLEQFFEEISHQNPKLMTVWQDYLHWLSYAVINLRMIFDGKIILGGYVGGYLAPYLDSLRDQVRRMDPFGHTGDYLFCGKYRQLASAYGAALRPLDTFLESI